MIEVLRWSSMFSPLVPLVCLLIYRKSQPRQNLILAISLCISFTFDMIGSSLARNHMNNSLSNNLYFIFAFPAIMWFYHETLVKRSLKILVRVFTVGFLLLALIFALDQGLNVLNYNTMILSSILISITSFFFVGDLNLMDERNFTKGRFHETNIILNTSLALYYFFTIILFSLTDYVFTHLTAEDAIFFWGFHNALHVLKNVGVTVAFYLSAKRSRILNQKPSHHRV
jgi:hypothetical protein